MTASVSSRKCKAKASTRRDPTEGCEEEDGVHSEETLSEHGVGVPGRAGCHLRSVPGTMTKSSRLRQFSTSL